MPQASVNDKKILVLVESINVNDSSATKGRVAFIESFIQAGYQVTVLHYTQKGIQMDGVNCVPVKEMKISANYVLSRVQRYLYRWFKINISKYVHSLYGFSFGFFSDVLSFSKALNNFTPGDYQMIWTFGKGTSFRTHAAVLKHKIWHSKWYAFVHDPYPQHLYPRPYNFVEYGFKKQRNFFRDITVNAYRMVFPSLMLKEWMESYFIDIKGKSLILPHQLVLKHHKRSDIPDFFDTSKFNILHAGSLLDLRNPEPIFSAYTEFLNRKPDAKKDSSLFFIGKTSVFSNYMRDMAKQIPQIYISDGYLPFNQVYAMQQESSINVILEASSEISPFLPGKFPHCVAADKPIIIIGPYYSECKRLMGDDSSYVFDFNDAACIADKLVELYIIWKENKNNLRLNRPDIKHYLSVNYLKETLGNPDLKIC